MQKVIHINEQELKELISEAVKQAVDEGIFKNAWQTARKNLANTASRHGAVTPETRRAFEFLGLTDYRDDDWQEIKRILRRSQKPNSNSKNNKNNPTP